MALTDMVIMKGEDWQAICDATRNLTGHTKLLKSKDVADEFNEFAIYKGIEYQPAITYVRENNGYLEYGTDEGVNIVADDATIYKLPCSDITFELNITPEKIVAGNTILGIEGTGSSIKEYVFTGTASNGVVSVSVPEFFDDQSFDENLVSMTLTLRATDIPQMLLSYSKASSGHFVYTVANSSGTINTGVTEDFSRTPVSLDGGNMLWEYDSSMSLGYEKYELTVIVRT